MKKLLLTMLFILVASTSFAERFMFEDSFQTKNFFLADNDNKSPCFDYGSNNDNIAWAWSGAAETIGSKIGKVNMTISTPAGTISKDWGTIGYSSAKMMLKMSCRDYKKMSVIYSSMFNTENVNTLNTNAIYLLSSSDALGPYPLLTMIFVHFQDGSNIELKNGKTVKIRTNKVVIDLLSALTRNDDIAFKKALNAVPDEYIQKIKFSNFDLKQWRADDIKKTKEQLDKERLEELKKKYGKR